MKMYKFKKNYLFKKIIFCLIDFSKLFYDKCTDGSENNESVEFAVTNECLKLHCTVRMPYLLMSVCITRNHRVLNIHSKSISAMHLGMSQKPIIAHT